MADSINALQCYPWHQDIANQWLADRSRFAHAWLIQGLAGIGKVQFALAGAAALLCEHPVNALACGRCASCQWVLGGNHPDLRLIRPEAIAIVENPELASSAKNPSKHIRVEQLRELTTWFNTATHRGGYRVAVLYPAENLNPISANALLKVLEEPPANTIFLLVTHQYERLLPTILSRCRRLPLALPTPQQSVAWLGDLLDQPEQWLAAVGGAPVAALAASKAHEQPYPAWLPRFCELLAQAKPKAILALAPQLEAMDTVLWVDVLQRLYVDLQLASLQMPVRYYPALASSIQKMALNSSSHYLQQQWKWLVAQKQHAEHPLNAKLLVHTALERVAQGYRST